ncbi:MULTISPECIES: MSMEG_0570 family nitrogen starvation response protein [unclassified Streptomyces]|uniref:MSMEG_0570 family nitrogen starvation response protein n=1 Tax=unclassified Streptomyces TaxID=2593676 RepID=UPI00380DFE44
MPELYFHVRWPDGEVGRCYSPSTVVEDYFAKGDVYELADFVERSRTSLSIAGERVREKYGFFCTGASDQLAEIERTAAAYASLPGASVTVESLRYADGSER